MRITVVTGVLALGVLATACGGANSAERTAEDGSSITLPAPAGGPVPDLPVAESAATSPLPDIAVRQLNGDGGWVQLKNELPAEQPTLVWFWAPH